MHRNHILDPDEEAEGSGRRITVRRKHILDDTLKSLRRTPWQLSKHLRVVFMGEAGIDDRGPRREFLGRRKAALYYFYFFRLLLLEVGRNNSYFQGPANKRVPHHNIVNLHNNVFFYVGQIIALSLVHDGPCVQWLAPTTVKYLLGLEVVPNIDDIPDIDIQRKMKGVSS